MERFSMSCHLTLLIDTDLHKVYVVHALPKHYFVRRDGQAYERKHYYAQPDDYESIFHTTVSPRVLSRVLSSSRTQL